MEWTNVPPTEPGYYWHSLKRSDTPTLVEIAYTVEERNALHCFTTARRRSRAVSDMRGHWWKPIAVPPSPSADQSDSRNRELEIVAREVILNRGITEALKTTIAEIEQLREENRELRVRLSYADSDPIKLHYRIEILEQQNQKCLSALEDLIERAEASKTNAHHLRQLLETICSSAPEDLSMFIRNALKSTSTDL